MGGGGAEAGGAASGALWAGFTFMTSFTLLFMRASYHSRSKTSRVYHYLTTLITALAAMAYLVMALGIGGIWVRYIDWLLTTPMLLADLAFLAGMGAPEVGYLCVIDMMMIAAGYTAQMSYAPAQVWGMFAFSISMFAIIVFALVSYLRTLVREHTGTVEAKAYKFLSVWTMALWLVYPLLFVLEKANVVSPATEDVIHCVLDILAKGIFGVILVGSREALEGESTGESLLAMAVIGIDPLQRRASMSGAHMKAVDFLTNGATSASSNATSEAFGMDVERGDIASKGTRANFDGRFAPSRHDRSVGRNNGKALLDSLQGSPEPDAMRGASYTNIAVKNNGLSVSRRMDHAQPRGAADYARNDGPEYNQRGAVDRREAGLRNNNQSNGSPGGFVGRMNASEYASMGRNNGGNDAAAAVRAILEAAARDPTVLSGLIGTGDVGRNAARNTNGGSNASASHDSVPSAAPSDAGTAKSASEYSASSDPRLEPAHDNSGTASAHVAHVPQPHLQPHTSHGHHGHGHHAGRPVAAAAAQHHTGGDADSGENMPFPPGALSELAQRLQALLGSGSNGAALGMLSPGAPNGSAAHMASSGMHTPATGVSTRALLGGQSPVTMDA